MIQNPTLAVVASCLIASGWTLTGGQPETPRQSDRPVLSTAPSWETLAEKFGGTKADTKPCQDVTMAFTVPAEIRQVLVKSGQAVKAGDLLVRARDDDQVAVVDGQKIQAQNENRIHSAELQKELAELQFKRVEEAKAKGSFSPQEYDQRRIEAANARVQLEQEKTQLELEKMRLKQAEGLLARYRLEAQWDGIVEEVKVEAGQGVKDSEPVVRLVNINRLWLETYAPTQETLRLKIGPGTKAWVLVSLPDQPKVVEGRVLYVSPVAESVSQTRRTRVELDNTESWPAGTPAMVRFTEPGPEWAAFRMAPGRATPTADAGSTADKTAVAEKATGTDRGVTAR